MRDPLRSQGAVGGCWRPEAGERPPGVGHLSLGSQRAEPGAELWVISFLGREDPVARVMGAGPGAAARCLTGFQEAIQTASRDRLLGEEEGRTLCPSALTALFSRSCPVGPEWGLQCLIRGGVLDGGPGKPGAADPSVPRGELHWQPGGRGPPRTLPEVPEQWRKRGPGPGAARVWVLSTCTCTSGAGESGGGPRPNPDPSVLPRWY